MIAPSRSHLLYWFAWLVVAGGLVGCRPRPDTAYDPAVVTAMNRGVALMGQYDYEGAAQAFEEVAQARPDLVEAQVNLAMALFNRGRRGDQDLDRAGQLLEAVLVRQPRHLRALYFLGILRQQQGQAERAIPYFEQVLAQRPEDGAAWYLLGLSKQRVQQPAEHELLQAVKYRPYLFSAYYRLWQLAMMGGETNKAEAYMAQFKQLRESPLGEVIELPQYQAMGELALVEPLARQGNNLSRARYTPGAWQPLLTAAASAHGGSSAAPATATASTHALPHFTGGAVGADFNGDGLVDLAVLLPPPQDGPAAGQLRLLLGQASGGWRDAGATSGLPSAVVGRGLAVGDADNDGQADLYLAGDGPAPLWRGRGDGTFAALPLTGPTNTAPPRWQASLFLDADHDGDLDLLTVGPSGTALWNNNTDGTWTHRLLAAPTHPATNGPVAILAGDVDQDRDLDLIVLESGAPARLFLNELLGSYRPAPLVDDRVRADHGGVLQDFDGDGLLDLLTLGSEADGLALYRGDGRGQFQPVESFASVASAARTWGPLRALRVADLDLDGDLDVALIGRDGHLLLNDGQGRFVLQSQVWRFPAGAEITGGEWLDLNLDLVPDLILIGRQGETSLLTWSAGALQPPSTGLALSPTGLRGRDGRTRSPASGYGVKATLRAGLREQTLLYTGLNGGPNQSHLPLILGLNGVGQADYVRLLWPDGVLQMETALAAGQPHALAELQRKISSCPVLFAWDGQRMGFITDFAGVGGLGYFVGPGEYGQPRVLEHVKLEPDQLRPKDGVYELRVGEPMEETAYLDRLELRAVDHPAAWRVFPDERAVAGGPPPTHELLVVEEAVFPLQARGPAGEDCEERVREIDRRYAYEPPLDRRFIGFCAPHQLELDFGGAVAGWSAKDRVFLFIAGYLEYPYSQTVYAASQAGVAWQAVRVERRAADGSWETLVPDGGWPGGMGRVFTLNLSGHAWGPQTRLRLRTNLEIYYDQIFLARDAGAEKVRVHSVPLREALFQKRGFPREYSPDGRQPLLYDYELCDASAPFHVLKGAYTRYGPVEELLRDFDDQYVVVGPGDEVALRFDAASLPPVPAGLARSFLLVSHAYCKDMDLYTATPQTLEPWPFHGMSRYPYPAAERPPNTPARRAWLTQYQTRLME